MLLAGRTAVLISHGARAENERIPVLEGDTGSGFLEASNNVSPPLSTSDGQDLQSQRQPDSATAAQITRAKTVAKIINELNMLKPQMFEDASEYDKLHVQHHDFLVFAIAKERPDLKRKILAINGSTGISDLAQELAAAHHGRRLSTIQQDWKNFKPTEFRRPR